jgi:steroid delta-isomerase-like uncharacterized protein
MRRSYEFLTAHDVDGFGDLLADDFIEHEGFPDLPPTKDGVKDVFRMYFGAFPDLRFEVQDVLSAGDKVVARVRCSGTNEGEFMGMPPTGKRFEVDEIDIVRFGEDGLGHEHWGVFDAMGMMQQLGAIPEGPPD